MFFYKLATFLRNKPFVILNSNPYIILKESLSCLILNHLHHLDIGMPFENGVSLSQVMSTSLK